MDRHPASTEKLGLLAQWRGDLLGGTVAALIAIPYGMALSIAMGLRPEAGLYTSIIGGLISGMLSRAPIVVSGLSATMVPVLAALIKTHGVGAALAAGVLSGLLMTLIGVMRWGRFFNYLPRSVIGAFTSGLGVIIVVSQLRLLFGVEPGTIGFNLGVVDDLWGVLLQMKRADGRVFFIGLVVLVTMFGMPKLLPRLERQLPSSLVGVVLATMLAQVMRVDLARVGELPSRFAMPSLLAVDFSNFSDLINPALTLAGLMTINQLLTIVVTDRLTPDRGEVRFNRELFAQGVANTVCPLFGAPPGVAMLARTVASKRAGAVTRWSVIAHSAVLILFLLPLRSLISQIPLVVLAGVTVGVGLQLIGIERWRELRDASRMEVTLFLLTFGLVVVSDLIVGVGVGMFVAMLHYVERSAESTQLKRVGSFPDLPMAFPAQGWPHQRGLEQPLVRGGEAERGIFFETYRLTGPLFFGSSERIIHQLSGRPAGGRLILDLSEAGPIDSGALDSLRRLGEQQRREGGELYLVGIDRLADDQIVRSGLLRETAVKTVRDHLAWDAVVQPDPPFQGEAVQPPLRPIL
jgi:SulP family sulfate permease